MIYLFTGTPGAGKTLGAIQFVQEDPAFQGRDVYQYGIRGLKLDWHELSSDDVYKWFDLPHGSVVLLDECQAFFEPAKFGNHIPEHIKELNTHRHRGIDLVLITQHPKLIDTKVRRLVGDHRHRKRQFGFESSTVFHFQEVADDPNDYHTQQAATKKRWKFPKKYYGNYESAEVHTHKKRTPWMLYALPLLLAGCLGALYWVASGFGASDSSLDTPAAESAPASSQDRPGFTTVGSAEDESLTAQQYAAQLKPRLDADPASAPIYDDVREVNSYPRPQCIRAESSGDCNCYTQQATPLDISERQCNAIVEDGYWDKGRSDPARSEEKAEASSERGGSTSVALRRFREASAIRADMKETRHEMRFSR